MIRSIIVGIVCLFFIILSCTLPAQAYDWQSENFDKEKILEPLKNFDKKLFETTISNPLIEKMFPPMIKMYLAIWPGFIKLRSDRGDTILHDVSAVGYEDSVILLLEKGAEIDARDNYGLTPLHHATFHGHIEVVELLIAGGADVNIKSKDGNTPLHNAAWKGHKEVCEILLNSGADVNSATKKKILLYFWLQTKITMMYVNSLLIMAQMLINLIFRAILPYIVPLGMVMKKLLKCYWMQVPIFY